MMATSGTAYKLYHLLPSYSIPHPHSSLNGKQFSGELLG